MPDLFYAECADILWRYVRRMDLGAEEARRGLERLSALALLPVPGQEVIAEALDLAVRHEITSYDACYVAVAQGEQVPLVTADFWGAYLPLRFDRPVFPLDRSPCLSNSSTSARGARQPQAAVSSTSSSATSTAGSRSRTAGHRFLPGHGATVADALQR